jgi:hypothetical protein
VLTIFLSIVSRTIERVRRAHAEVFGAWNWDDASFRSSCAGRGDYCANDTWYSARCWPWSSCAPIVVDEMRSDPLTVQILPTNFHPSLAQGVFTGLQQFTYLQMTDRIANLERERHFLLDRLNRAQLEIQELGVKCRTWECVCSLPFMMFF